MFVSFAGFVLFILLISFALFARYSLIGRILHLHLQLYLPFPYSHSLSFYTKHNMAMGTSTRSLHADGALNVVADVAAPLHVSTTFRYPDNPDELVPAADQTVRSPYHPERFNKTGIARANLTYLLPLHSAQHNPFRNNPLLPAEWARN